MLNHLLTKIIYIVIQTGKLKVVQPDQFCCGAKAFLTVSKVDHRNS